MSLSYASKYIFGIGLSFAVVCVLFALCWRRIELIWKKLWVLVFPADAAAHRTKTELQSLLDLNLMEHNSGVQQKVEDVGLDTGAVRSRSWKKYAAQGRPALDDHFVGYQV